ncbi:unnamed protein product [Caenorhabditis brenneri]
MRSEESLALECIHESRQCEQAARQSERSVQTAVEEKQKIYAKMAEEGKTSGELEVWNQMEAVRTQLIGLKDRSSQTKVRRLKRDFAEKDNSKHTCLLSNERHISNMCPKYTDVGIRKRILEEKKLCFKRLKRMKGDRRKHVNSCQAAKPCFYNFFEINIFPCYSY